MKNKLEIISEIGSVHDGSIGNAKKLIDLSKSCGATTVKFQIHNAEDETLISAPSPAYFNEESRFEYFKRTSFTKFQWRELIKYAGNKKIDFMVSPFSIKSFKILEEIGCKKIKIPSGEVNNYVLLEYIAKSKKKIYLSSGMSNWKELDEAINIFKNNDLTIMQCTSIYPCPNNMVGLNIISELKKKYNHNIGFSDHTEGYAAAIGAVIFGATCVEKHLTFSRSMYGSDALNAMEPNDFNLFCKNLNDIWKIYHNPVDKNNLNSLKKTKEVFEKSIVSNRRIEKGQEISLKNITFKKPGTGLKVNQLKGVIGLKLKKTIEKNTIIKKEDLK